MRGSIEQLAADCEAAGEKPYPSAGTARNIIHELSHLLTRDQKREVESDADFEDEDTEGDPYVGYILAYVLYLMEWGVDPADEWEYHDLRVALFRAKEQAALRSPPPRTEQMAFQEALILP
jgi:hypothetical protein